MTRFYYRGYTCTMSPTSCNNISLRVFAPAACDQHGPVPEVMEDEVNGKELDGRIFRSKLAAKYSVRKARRWAMKYIDARCDCFTAIEAENTCW